ncbi:MAG: class I SAM-dependent methyltransferase [Eubacteriales bacterium]|nr:class I SAM-dependent methyltransferase [Eubacteriales bacterium]
MGGLQEENSIYWNNRASGYSEVNQEELEGIQRKTWSKLLERKLTDRFGDRSKAEIRILDIGAGPGFLSIILTEMGYAVTAADFSEEMQKHARGNAGELADRICFRKEDAQNLSFADASFDVVLSRNLTWNLPDPEQAYREWNRVLKKDGMLLVFDANWYTYLIDQESRLAYEQDRKNVEANGLGDYNVGENFDKMEVIAGQLPMTGRKRPEWDREFLLQLQIPDVRITADIGAEVYSDKEKLNYASTPMFMIEGYKE